MELCEQCGNNPAEVHITKIVNGEKTEAHLCRSCAENTESPLMDGMNLGNILVALLNAQGHKAEEQAPGIAPCPQCGYDFTRFKKGGMLGCEDCYVHFAQALSPIIKRMQGAGHHSGRRPQKSEEADVSQPDALLESLKTALAEAVGREEYEQAAVLRDQIKELETQERGNDGKQL